jgi:D-3-phosphoglycerate dehydrogenase / 2-oxoglutarate reductase
MKVMDPVEALITDLLEWIGPQGRRYGDVMEAWRTSCPRLPVWEEANARGYIAKTHQPGHEAWISLTQAGRAHLGRTLPEPDRSDRAVAGPAGPAGAASST